MSFNLKFNHKTPLLNQSGCGIVSGDRSQAFLSMPPEKNLGKGSRGRPGDEARECPQPTQTVIRSVMKLLWGLVTFL